uniref:Uncharacterized protein n=1 Tax=Arundo donax TaxID=35708 RepID=A0A0A9FB55_ARUDO
MFFKRKFVPSLDENNFLKQNEDKLKVEYQASEYDICCNRNMCNNQKHCIDDTEKQEENLKSW